MQSADGRAFSMLLTITVGVVVNEELDTCNLLTDGHFPASTSATAFSRLMDPCRCRTHATFKSTAMAWLLLN
jgi:hypothetical protein